MRLCHQVMQYWDIVEYYISGSLTIVSLLLSSTCLCVDSSREHGSNCLYCLVLIVLPFRRLLKCIKEEE